MSFSLPLPLVLSIHLKRFDHGLNGKHGGATTSAKLEHYVRFPLEGLDMLPYTSAPSSGASPSPAEALVYDLFCVIVHKGSLDTGHYLCYIRHRTGKWFRSDDRIMNRVDCAEVANCNAYVGERRGGESEREDGRSVGGSAGAR
jgi:ubiquitin carboxyl-terminal hydrolase 22/27/51